MRLPWGRPSLRPYRSLEKPAVISPGALTACFLGTSSVLLDDGYTSLLCDGFVARPSLQRVIWGRIAPDRTAVADLIKYLNVRDLDAVFCAHSHYDHALDAPVWCLATGADLVGSESTANVGRGLGVPEPSLRVVGHTDTISYGRFGLTFIESLHSPGDHYPGTIDAPLIPPARAGTWKTGTAFSVLVTHPQGRILIHASANYRPGMLDGHTADVVYLGIGALGKQPADFVRAYWDDIVATVGARRVFPVHWDDFFVSLNRPLRPMRRYADYVDVTFDRLMSLADRDAVELVIPAALQPTAPLSGLTCSQRRRVSRHPRSAD